MSDLRGGFREGTKLVILPHLPAIVGVRGASGILAEVYREHFKRGGGFDELAGYIGGVAKRTRRTIDFVLRPFRRRLAAAGLVVGVDGDEMILVGWSPKAGRVLAFEYDSSTGFERVAIDPEYIAPAPGGLFDRLSPNSADNIARIAAAQVARIKAHDACMAAGGQLVIARIDRDGVAIRRMPIGLSTVTDRATLLNVGVRA